MVIVTERLQEVAEDSDLLATPLDIKGAYTGEITIAGSLDSPNVAWKISGDDWLWNTSRNVVFEIPRQPGIVAINKLLVEGNYNNQAITLDSFLVQGAQAVVALEGKLKGEQVTADYKIQDLPIDAIDNFIDIPFDLAGRISTTGKASQSLPTPKLVGDVALTNGRLSDRNLPQITGKYVYNNARLELDTTETPSAQIQASIAFPFLLNDEEETDLNNAIADTDPENAFKPQLTDFEVVLADFKFNKHPYTNL